MKILAIQNRMGIGDTVIFLPFIRAIYKKFNTPISLLVKESSKADQFLYQTNYIKEIIFLERNENKKRHEGFFGSLKLVNDLKKYNFDKVFIFNSSIRYNLIARLSKIPEIYQYPLFQKNKQHLIETPRKFLKNKISSDVKEDPIIELDEISVLEAIKKYKINKDNLNILLGIGGSGPTKRIPANTFIKVIGKISERKKSRFFLATGKKTEEQLILKEILDSKYKNLCSSLDDLTIKQTLPIIKNCDISICNDTGFGHLSSALGVKTISLIADAPLLYGNYSSLMFPITPDGVEIVTHGTNGKNKINSDKIFEKFLELSS
tara:strand:+ start:742 stop:1701 length:960 start_codon:yes stop_codon:yes gene_type:complete